MRRVGCGKRLPGTCISGDANFCSRDLLDLIIDRSANYLVTLKGKSPMLHREAKAAFAHNEVPMPAYQTLGGAIGEVYTTRRSPMRYASI